MRKKGKLVRDHGKNTCLTDCVGKMFGIDPRRVPFFIERREGWLDRLSRFFARRGYTLEVARFKPSLLANRRRIYLVTGLSPRSRAKKWSHPRAIHHAVLYRGRERYYDPSPSAKFLRKPVWIYRAVKRAKIKETK